MDNRDAFTKWMDTVEEALASESSIVEDSTDNKCNCGKWNCNVCFPDSKNPHPPSGKTDMSAPGSSSKGKAMVGKLKTAKNEIEYDTDGLHEEDNDFVETNKTKKGVKLGDIVQKTEFVKTGGQNSPLSYSEDNLDEDDLSADMDADHDPSSGYGDKIEDDEREEIINQISYMQDSGLSKDDQHYEPEELYTLSPEELGACRDRVMGTVAEATTKPTQPPRSIEDDPFADMDDVLSPRQDNPVANQNSTGNSDPKSFDLPIASRNDTRRSMQGMTPSEVMRSYLNRINPDAGADEPELPDAPNNEITIRTARDIPAVITTAMRTTGTVSPIWHTINNLPGYENRNVRGIGRSMFGMITSTPLEDIKTIANVGGQGPNTKSEVNAVAAWLKREADDLGRVDIGFGDAIPGYRPEVNEYRKNGIRFHVVRDPMGEYIYAFPDEDALSNAGGQDMLSGGNMPQLREAFSGLKLSLFEELKLDERIRDAVASIELTEGYEADELDESSLSKRIGDTEGGQQLVSLLHKKYRLDNTAGMRVTPFERKLLWSTFKSNPDDFVIIQGDKGVAAIKPSKKYIEAKTAAHNKKGTVYNPGRDTKLPYHIHAFYKNGEPVPSRLLRPTDDVDLDPDANPAPKDIVHLDPTLIKPRIGGTYQSGTYTPDDIIKLIDDEIGPIKNMWISGWHGHRKVTDVPIKPPPPKPWGSVPNDLIKSRAERNAPTKYDLPGEANSVDRMAARRTSLENIFKKLRPVLRPVADSVDGRVSAATNRAANGKNRKELQRLAKIGEVIDDFKIALDTDRDISLAGVVGNIFKDAIKSVSGATTDDELDQYIAHLASPHLGSSQKMVSIAQAIKDRLLGVTGSENE